MMNFKGTPKMTKYQFELDEEIKTCGDCPCFYDYIGEFDWTDQCQLLQKSTNPENIPSEVGCPLVKVEVDNDS